jgi:zinc transporter, ZIP family
MWLIVLVDLFVDGVVNGSGSMPDLLTGLVITLGMALSTAPLAFVAIAAAKRQGILAEHWRLLGEIVVAARMGGSAPPLPRAPESSPGTADGVGGPAVGLPHHDRGAGIISEANRGGKPGFAGVLYVGRPSLYTLMSPALIQRR